MSALRVTSLLLLASVLCGCATTERLAELALHNRIIMQTNLGNCQGHLETALTHFQGLDDYQAEPIFSCPQRIYARHGECHVSTLVTHTDGSRWVLDNGAILHDTFALHGVASWSDFLWALNGEPYWRGDTALLEMTSHVMFTGISALPQTP